MTAEDQEDYENVHGLKKQGNISLSRAGPIPKKYLKDASWLRQWVIYNLPYIQYMTHMSLLCLYFVDEKKRRR